MIRKDSLLGKLQGMHWFLVLSILVLATCGIAVLFSAGTTSHDPVTGEHVINPTLAMNHAARFIIAFLLAIAAALVPLRLWAALAFPAYFIGVAMLLAVDIGGVIINGSQRWLDIGPLRLQPSELMKLATPIALARFYHVMHESGRTGIWIHIPALAIVSIPTALVFHQPDLGTGLMIFSAGAAVIFFAGLSLRVIIALLVMVAAAVPLAYYFVLHDYQRQRVETMFNPEADPLGAGYQLQQGLIAIGSGGFTGKGYMEGVQKELDFIPEQRTDFIFTVVAEEFGFAGSIVILLIWATVLIQGLTIAGRSRSVFGGLAAAGFVSTLAFYVLVNIGMVIGLLPVVGVPLPLISHGGTAMLTVMIGFGLLMSVHLNRDQNMSLRGVL
jgi:rod shape determining protein RodA